MNRKHVVAFCLAVGCFMLVQPDMRAGASAASDSAQTPNTQTPGAQTSSPRQSPTPASGLSACGNTVLQDGTRVHDVRVRLRNVDTATIVGQSASDRNGAFTFAVQAPGNYVVEAVNRDGSVIAVGPPLNLVSGPVCQDVILPSTTRAAGTGFFHSAAFPILVAAGGAGLAAWAISSSQASSPER